MGNYTDWFLRFAKGTLIGIGAIMPGVSGGALAAVFGLYERIISFLAHITKDFVKNVIFFIPVGLGGLFGIFVLSFALSFFLENYEAQILWLFVGCIVGILPALFEQAGRRGRNPLHFVIMAVSAVAALVFLRAMEGSISGGMPQNIGTWTLAGVIFGLGLIVPGLSPSNFLVYMGMYKPMTDGIKNLDFGVIIPLLIGAALVVLTLSKLIDFAFEKMYAGLFHFILGVVAASTIMIIPVGFNYFSLAGAACAVACVLGIALGLWMSGLEKKYKGV